MNFVAPALHATLPSLRQSRGDLNILNKLPVNIYAVTANALNDLHWHDYTQIWYTVSGSYYHTINGVRTLQTAGSIALIYPFTIHAVDTSETDLEVSRIISISIPNDVYVKNQMPLIPLTYSLATFDNFSLSPFIKLSGKNKERADEFCENALAEYQKNQAMSYRKIFNNIISLLELCATMQNAPMKKRDVLIAHERAMQIGNAVYYMTENSSEKLPLSLVSSWAMMSERSFTDKFKLTVGQTYRNYLLRVRIAKAADLLRFTNKRTSEIAAECGFSNGGHLTNICTDICGISPIALRRYYREHAKRFGHLDYEKTLSVMWAYNWNEDELSQIERMAKGEI